MIVKIKILDKNGEEFIMMFGNSYRHWYDQFEEFMYRHFTPLGEGWNYKYIEDKVLEVWKSTSKWKSFGGLKWCSEDNFQNELNREGCQYEDKDNPKPRQYFKMKFEKMPIEYAEKHLRY